MCQKFLIYFCIHEICIGLFFAMTGLFLKMYLQRESFTVATMTWLSKVLRYKRVKQKL